MTSLSAAQLVELLCARLPAGDERFRLKLEAPPYIDEGGGLVAPLWVEVLGADGAVLNAHAASWILASGKDLSRPERVAAYLEAWIGALPELVNQLPADRRELLTIDDVAFPALLDDPGLESEADFSAAIADAQRMANLRAAAFAAASTQPCVEISWDVIEEWASQNAPELAQSLCPGASDQDLSSFLSVAPFADLPEAFLESWRRHDGQSEPLGLVRLAFHLLPLRKIREAWTALTTSAEGGAAVSNEAPPEVRAAYFHPGWIPIASGPSGQFLCLDLAPTDTGQVGQVVLFAPDDGARPCLTSSLEGLLGEVNALLNEDVLVFSKGQGCLVVADHPG